MTDEILHSATLSINFLHAIHMYFSSSIHLVQWQLRIRCLILLAWSVMFFRVSIIYQISNCPIFRSYFDCCDEATIWRIIGLVSLDQLRCDFMTSACVLHVRSKVQEL